MPRTRAAEDSVLAKLEIVIGDMVIRTERLTVEHLARVIRGGACVAMIAPGADLKIYMATRPVDFRAAMMGLRRWCRRCFGLDPFSGAAFVFRAKRADRIKILVWDRTGMVLVHKRLEGCKFVWPQVAQRCDADIACNVRGLVRRAGLATCSS